MDAQGQGIGGAWPRAKGFQALGDPPVQDEATRGEQSAQIVHTEDGGAVDAVMIGGRMVVEGGRVTTVDAGKLAAMAEAAVARLRGANESTRGLAQRLEPVVGTLPRAGGTRIPRAALRRAAGALIKETPNARSGGRYLAFLTVSMCEARP